MNELENAIVTHDVFKRNVEKMLSKPGSITAEEIDVAYIYLCRGIKGEFVKS